MKAILIPAIAVGMSLGMSGAALAGDAAAGKAKAAVCAACHGLDGVATQPIYPNLKGQNAAYIKSAIKAYQNGQRTGGQSAVMAAMAKPLTDADIDNLAAYYSSL